MSKTLCIVNHKGGVGKTHTCFHLAGALADAGKRVLAVDLDAQANLSRLLLESLQGATLYDVLHDQVELAEVIQATQLRGIDLAPSDVRLEDLASVLRDEPDQQIRLDTAIRERQSQPNPYDFVIVDCPPSLTLPTRNALAAADGVVIPLEADNADPSSPSGTWSCRGARSSSGRSCSSTDSARPGSGRSAASCGAAVGERAPSGLARAARKWEASTERTLVRRP